MLRKYISIYLDCWVQEGFLEPLSALQLFSLEVIVKLKIDNACNLLDDNSFDNNERSFNKPN